MSVAGCVINFDTGDFGLQGFKAQSEAAEVIKYQLIPDISETVIKESKGKCFFVVNSVRPLMLFIIALCSHYVTEVITADELSELEKTSGTNLKTVVDEMKNALGN